MAITANLSNRRPERVVEGEDSPVVGNDTTATKVWKWWKLTRDHLSGWRTEAHESYDIVAGHQWTSEEQATLREQLRPIVTFNRTSVIVDSVAGYQINNRQDVTYQPRQVEDSGPVQVESEAARYFRGQCDAEDEETDAFTDLLVTGLACVEHRMDYEDDPAGMLKVTRTDIMEMGYDPNASGRNLTDRRWDIRGKWWNREVAMQTFPGHSFFAYGGVAADMDDLLEKQPIDRVAAFYYRDTGVGQSIDRHKDSVFILEATWFELEPFLMALDPRNGQMQEVKAEQVEAINAQLALRQMPPLRVLRQHRKVYKRAFVYGPDTLEEANAPCPNAFHYQFMTGKRDRNKNVWFGLGRLMKDPQRWANKFFSQTMHMLNANAKGGIIHTEGAFVDPSRVENQLAKPGWRVEVREGYFDQVRFEQPMQMPPDIFKLTEFAIGSVRDTTGVNVEMLGQTQREQPGVVESLRKQSAMAILASFFDALRRYHKSAGRLTLYFINTFMSDGRLVRVAGPTGAKYVPLTKRADFTKYDIIVDESPTSTNSREGFWAVLMQVLPMLMQAGVPVPPDVLDYVPNLPADLAQRWKAMLIPNKQAEFERQQDKDAQQKWLASESEKNLASAAKSAADAKVSMVKAATTPMEVLQMLHQMRVDVEQLKTDRLAAMKPQGGEQ